MSRRTLALALLLSLSFASAFGQQASWMPDLTQKLDYTLHRATSREATAPNHGWTGQWYGNGDPLVNYTRNLDGKDNYLWMEAKGDGQYVGVTYLRRTTSDRSPKRR